MCLLTEQKNTLHLKDVSDPISEPMTMLYYIVKGIKVMDGIMVANKVM